MVDLVHKSIKGDTAVKIALSIEEAIRAGRFEPGERLPTIRDLADQLAVSPATVSAAYRALQTRGLAFAQGRRGTRISHRPVHPNRWRGMAQVPARNLFDGNPDPALLPDFHDALRRIDTTHTLYGRETHQRDLIGLVAREAGEEGIAKGEWCVVSGAMDGIDRVLAEYLRPGDMVAVEDPGFTGVHDLAMARGLTLVPVQMDQEGILPDRLQHACAQGAKALVVTPRCHSPTGAAITVERARELRRVLRGAPEVIIIEDDHMRLVTDVPLGRLHEPKRSRWAYLHSLSKSLNPDLRLAVMTGDSTTVARVHDRQIVGERWVSHILQRLTYELLSDRGVRRGLVAAGKTYTRRRTAVIDALARHGLHGQGSSGYNVWLPVTEETSTVQGLASAGWAVRAGESFRLSSPPAIRITTSTLDPSGAGALADAFADALGPRRRTTTA